MNQILLNQKTVATRKEIRKIQSESKRVCGSRKGVVKARIGKLVKLSGAPRREKFPDHLQSQPELERLLMALKETQLTGMSGNGFPVSEKIEKISQYPSPRILLVNGVECEPGLLHDKWLLQNHEAEIKNGIQLLQRMIPFEKSILAYSMDKKEQRVRRKEAVTETFGRCHVPAGYPMGEEHFLIKQVLGKEIAKTEHPIEHGILVLNVQTVFHIYCLMAGCYKNGRYVTVANLDTGEAKIVYVTRGEKINNKLAEVFEISKDLKCYAGAGIMSAHAVTEEEMFSDQISFAAIGTPAEITNEHRCKGCGTCNRKCPAGVNVREIVRRREEEMSADISGLGLENCVHCGCCTFFCKAGKYTAAYFD